MENRERGLHSFCLARALKRSIDVAVAAIGILILSPALVAVVVAIRLVMGRPVLFRQTRPGYRAKPFTLYKFRTMREAYNPDGTPRPDAERLTQLGRFLRKTSLDESPQLWNVLKGDMSIVGPRPLLTDYLRVYSAEQMRRHSVRPGITGLAQVSGRQAIPFSKRLELDVRYVDSWSLFLDFRILLQTLRIVLLCSDVKLDQDIRDVDDVGFWGKVTAQENPR